MTAGAKTASVALLLVLVALTWEIIALASGERYAWTFSKLVWGATFSTPLVPLAFGVLMGHFFFPKGRCVHCGLRPWAGASENVFDARLMTYLGSRTEQRGRNIPALEAHLVAKRDAGFPTVPLPMEWGHDEIPPRPRFKHNNPGMSGGERS